jgi:hypothetical protein
LDVRKFSFAHRVVEVWNSLDELTVACDSTNSFKNRLDKFLYGQGFIYAFKLPSLLNYHTIAYYTILSEKCSEPEIPTT